MEFVKALTCLELNNYLFSALVVSIGISIFWFFKYCAAKGKYLELIATYGVDY